MSCGNIPPMGIFRVLMILSILLPMALFARPISYAGGYTLMAKSDYLKDSLYVHYSPRANFSFGIEMLEGKRGMPDRSYLRGTWLAHRLNKRKSQQNLYLDGGIDATSGEYFIGAMGDWETRRYFAGFSLRKMKWNTESFFNNYLQVGFAPYLGDYGDLHSWLMIKRKYNGLEERYSTYPVLRFFKGNWFFEAGSEQEIDWDIHLMYRF